MTILVGRVTTNSTSYVRGSFLAPSDGYFSNIELAVVDSQTSEDGASILHCFSKSYPGNIPAAQSEQILYPFPKDEGVTLEGTANEGSGLPITWRHFGKKRVYVRRGERLSFSFAELGTMSGARVALIRAKFTPKRGARIGFHHSLDNTDETPKTTYDYGGYVTMAFGSPFDIMKGAVIKIQLKLQGSDADFDGKMLVRHLKPSPQISNNINVTGNAGELWSSNALKDDGVIAHSAKRFLLAADVGIPRTQVFYMQLENHVNEGDVIAITFEDLDNTALALNILMEVEGEASGRSNGIYMFPEGSSMLNLTTYRNEVRS